MAGGCGDDNGMLIIPAVDIKDGRCVRLLRGRMHDETVYADTPWTMAVRWQDEGAELLHIVDLNGAFEGRGVNDDAVREIVRRVDMKTELGGGIRDMARIDALMAMGVWRVIIGTAAVENPLLVSEALARYGPERVAVGIDAMNGIARTRGWAENGRRPAVELALDMMALGVTRIIYTDIARDGMLTGPNIPETARMARETGMAVTASGGVASLGDIRALKELEPLGVDSVITGKALYEGKLDLKEAIEAALN